MKRLSIAVLLGACSLGFLAQAQGVGEAKAERRTGPAGAFKKLDINQDGFVSRAEASAYPRLQKEFDGIDRDRDGRLSPTELQEFRSARRKDHGDRQRTGFRQLDKDGDGFLSHAEIGGRPELQKRFNEIDSNQDQKLSRDEMRAARRSHRETKS